MSKGEKLIATNATARANFFIEDVFEAGIALTGTEVKSMRVQSPNLKDAWIEVRSSNKSKLEAWLNHAHVAPYSHGNIWNHEPTRPRKLLLHKHELEKIFGATTQKGFTAVPLRLYFKNGRVKVELGLGKGKKKHDKRQAIRERSEKRDISRALKNSRRSTKD